MFMMDEVINRYRSLLDENKGEQEYQAFLEENTSFIPRHFVQNHGIHFDLVLRKLRISSDMITDFVFLSKSSISWNYVLIEIEKPSSRFFKDGTMSIHNDFRSGVDQIKTWQAWFSNPSNMVHFEEQLSFLKKPVREAPVEIKYVLVTGRRSEYEGKREKIDLIKSYESPDFKIMSFDSLGENYANNDELYLGVRRNRSVDIVTEKIIRTDFLDWCDESDFTLSEPLKNSLIDLLTQEIANARSGSKLGQFGADRRETTLRKLKRMQAKNA